jgi:DNA-binding NtrC family response regulator
MTGLDLLDALRSLRRTVPVILSSGYGDASTLARARQTDVLAFLAKPFRAESLLPLLQQAMCKRADDAAAFSPHRTAGRA